jgi:hypothetical protein
MKKKLALRSGDVVTIKDVALDKLIAMRMCDKLSKHDGEILINSPLHLFIENLGLYIKPFKKQHTIRVPGKSYFKNIVVIEIKRKQPWYTAMWTNTVSRIFGTTKKA